MLEADFQNLDTEMQKQFIGTLIENQTQIQEIVNILGDIVDNVAESKVKIQPWQYHSQTLVNKILFTSNSILKLTEGVKLTSYADINTSVVIIDISSLYILSRALIENYLTLCYIYNNDLTEEEKVFRFKLWEIAGLTTRQNFNDPNNLQNVEQKEKEAKQIQTILNSIEESKEFKNLDKNNLRKISTYGLPRLQSWHNLINESNLNPAVFPNMYSFFSEYAHSEYLAILQIGQSTYNINDEQTKEGALVALGMVRMLNCATISYYTKHYSAAEIYFKSIPIQMQRIINMWRNITIKNTTPNSG